MKDKQKAQLNLCWEYCDLLKTEMENYKPGSYTIEQNRIRKNLHDKLCEAFGLQKGQAIGITDRVDEIDYNGSKLMKKLLELSHPTPEGANQ